MGQNETNERGHLLMPAIVIFCYLLMIYLEGRNSNCLFSARRKAEQFQKFELMSDDPKLGVGCQQLTPAHYWFLSICFQLMP